ncbi:MAG: UDP-N-acetylglucosamine pyrophosphorylase [Lentisphaerae bacterium]|nr:UDP-N-acetylglucosamine pyrophosphorylase [Lentisphaerota bacterium]
MSPRNTASKPGGTVQTLLKRGVDVRCPASVEIGSDVDPERIAPGVIIHAGCRVRGSATSIGPGCVVGREAPATVEDCQLGHGVELAGGYFAGSVFFDGARMGSCAHVRPGTIIEEEASAGHSVGFKQTVLFPYVTGGSLTNFCDALMAGGTGRDNHGEIGSSYVHFNFTPRGDKATASLIGDVPRGVMLDRPPVFLGGQGGLIGPVRIGYGCVIAAGAVWRRDALEEGQLLVGGQAPMRHAGRYDSRFIGGARRIVANCVIYIGNIHALKLWYRTVRPACVSDRWRTACCAGAERAAGLILSERVKRLGDFVEMLRDGSGPEAEWLASLFTAWPSLKDRLAAGPCKGDTESMDRFLGAAFRKKADGYLETVRSWSAGTRAAGTSWLSSVVDDANNGWVK